MSTRSSVFSPRRHPGNTYFETIETLILFYNTFSFNFSLFYDFWDHLNILWQLAQNMSSITNVEVVISHFIICENCKNESF